MYPDSSENNSSLGFQAAIWFEQRLSFHQQRSLLAGFFSVFILSGICWLLWGVTELISTGLLGLPVSSIVAVSFVVFLLSSVLCMLLASLHSFYLYYRLSCVEVGGTGKNKLNQTYPAAVWSQAMANNENPTVSNRFGRELLLRLGISLESVDPHNMPPITSDSVGLETADDDSLTIADILSRLCDEQSDFVDWLLDRGITKETARKAACWVERRNQRWVRDVRFWSPENLAEMGRIGRQFNYGKTPKLNRFTHRPDFGVFAGSGGTANAFAEDTRRLFQILSRPRSANAVLVGGVHEGVNDVIREVGNQLQTREAPQALADYRLRVLSLQSLLQATDSPNQFEQLLTQLCAEAVHAGNVLLVIKNFPRLLDAGQKRGIDMLTLLKPFIQNPQLPVLATSRSDDYHGKLQHSQFMQWFGAVTVSDLSGETFLSLLEEVAEQHEGSAVCTVDGLQAVIRYGREVITDDKMPHAAVDLLLEILQQSQGGFVGQEAVEAYVKQKTDMPVGSVGSDERQKLTHLEEVLHQRIIGQDQAVSAVSSALRRGRAGLEDSERPLGSFLFLGPTGVGKTETAKAVAAAYFDNQAVTLRFDMSEFTAADSVVALIGDEKTSGRLSDAARSNPSGVMLLDEFEKAHPDVQDLFLQILDEGFFTDGAGRSVSCSNHIIIATSNAGADEIFTFIADGIDPSAQKREIIDTIIADNVLRPELINRFTETVVFRPLSKEQLTAIADKFLQQLQARLRDRGIRLQLEVGVAEAVAQAGYDPEFGARAVRRYLQQTAENIIADKIITDGADTGQTIHLSVADVQAAD